MRLNPATRDSAQCLPFPAQQARLQLSLRFSPDEFRALALGLVPMIMEDKRFIFYEDGWLYFHRSWTGSGVFRARSSRTPDGWMLTEAYASRDPDQYNSTDDEYDQVLLRYLIERLLLSRDVPFPLPPELRGRYDPEVIQMNMVGYGRSAAEIDGAV